MIYHVVTPESWESALQQGFYEAPSLALEGFIHCSTTHQVKGVLERYYKDVPHLQLLHIDETKLTSPLKYELAPSINEEFPHIYGRLNLDAVVEVEKLN
ncbi:MAG: DUF952 domain-containing protein [Ferruginibacter sp.]|nr:DUF952 domain-containing protein [Ferruginibacter sp.]